jgi:hypothetical protein
MGKLTAQLQKTAFSFSGGIKVERFVADEDKVRNIVSHRSMWQ